MFRMLTLTTLTFLCTVAGGCYSWQVLPLTRTNLKNEESRGKELRFTLHSGKRVVMTVDEMKFPFIRGTTPSGGKALLNINQVMSVDAFSIDGKNTAGLAVGLAMGTAAVVALVVGMAAMNEKARAQKKPPSASCPFVYVDRGQGLEFAGEAYSGATFRSLQRKDLLPIPAPTGGSFRVRLANELPETDWTDLVQLVLVEHAPATRAVTNGLAGPPVLVGTASASERVRDLQGRDVTPLVRHLDGRAWESDLLLASRLARPALREGLVAVFQMPQRGARPVLELSMASTFWLDFVITRFLALLGDRFPRFARSADRPSERGVIRRWRSREGVDFTVEIRTSGRWRRVATVPAVGAMAFRHLAIPLPPVLSSAPGEMLKVRLRGGLGFLRVDSMALSTAAKGRATIRYLNPASVRDQDGKDASAATRKVDRRYHVMSHTGEFLDISFDIPRPQRGKTRSAFFRSSGYYTFNRPVGAGQSLGTARVIWHKPQSLARFGLDLFRFYTRRLKAKGPGHARSY